MQRLSRLNKLKSPLLVPEFRKDDFASVKSTNSEVVNDGNVNFENTNDENVNFENTNDDESSRKRKRGRPATKDKSVGTGPIQPTVNKAVQVRKPKCYPEKSH
jgi:hypothetical protein